MVACLAAVAFVMVEKRVAVPLLDLDLLRNRVLVGSTVAILIGAGTINALMYVLSLWFQDPSSLGFTPLQAGLATLPATVGLVLVAPLVPRFAARLGARQVVGLGFAITAAGFAVIGLTDVDWLYRAFVIPLIAIAVGMGMSNGPASSASTACVPVEQVGSASGVSNMARYVGAAVATALAATIYSSVTASQSADGVPTGEALTAGLSATAWVMAVFSLAASRWPSSWADMPAVRRARWRMPRRPPPLTPTPSPRPRHPRRRRRPDTGQEDPMHVNLRHLSHSACRTIGLAVTGILLLSLTGCSGDDQDASLKKAQATVTAKEKALTEAEAAAKAADAQFCTASTTYVTALDRYGDVLNASAPTVGDVRDAGSDLAQPGEEAQKAAAAVADTRTGSGHGGAGARRRPGRARGR